MKTLIHIHHYLRFFGLVSPFSKEEETSIVDFLLCFIYLVVIFCGVVIPTFALFIDESTSASEAIKSSILFVGASTGIVLILDLRRTKDETTDIFVTLLTLNEKSK